MTAMAIGHVRFEYHRMPAVAVLHDDGRWDCAVAPAIADTLNRDFSPVGKRSASGNWGEWELIAAACFLKGVAQSGPPPP